MRVNVVAHLLALVAEDGVLALFQVALDEVAQEPVKLDPRVIGSRQASAAQRAGRHTEIASVLLHHDVGGNLRRPEKRVLALVDREGLGYPLRVARIRIIVAPLEFFQVELVGRVPVYLVRRHEGEGAIGANAPHRLQEIECSHCVGIEVVEGNCGGPIVARLRRRMHDRFGFQLRQEGENALAIPHVQLVVLEICKELDEPLLVPTGVTLRPEEDGALVIVHPVDFPARFVEVHANLRSNQTG